MIRDQKNLLLYLGFRKDYVVDHVFRQYDIRGKMGSELPLEEVYDLTKAIAFYLKKRNPALKKIAVGADGRTHSPAFKESVCKALQESGLDVTFIGYCPSPVLYFSLFNLSVDGGLMITASHNGPEYNGIKICLGKESVWGDQIQEIKKLYHQKIKFPAIAKGTYQEYELINMYIEWLKNHFKDLIGMDLKVVVDCGNGAAGYVLPKLVEQMQWPNVQLLYPIVDGSYPHHEADPIIEENMADVKKLVCTTDVSLGIGLDGDCDRMAPMTKEGELVPGDKLLALFAQEILQERPHAKIVFDIKCSGGLQELIEKFGGIPIVSPSGHSIIKDQMKKHKASLAGELSCHFFFNDRYFGYDDGIYSALRLFEILLKTKKPLHELLRIFPVKYTTRELRIECPEDKKEAIVNAVKRAFEKMHNATIITLDGIKVVVPYGWGLLRASNTQSVLCLRFESDSQEGLKKIKNDFFSILNQYFDYDSLEK